MIEGLKEVLQYIAPFQKAELEEIVFCFKPKQVKKKASLLSDREVCKEFYYIHKGCIRTYFITRQGDEKTRYIMQEKHIGTAFASFISQTPSYEAIDALEDSELLTISYNDFYRLNKEIPGWRIFYQKILEMAYTFQNKKIETMVTLSAKERYIKLLEENPALILRLSNKILASYLDVREETLSRLKSK